MNKKRAVHFTIMLMFLVPLLGAQCSVPGQGGGDDDVTTERSDYRRGTDGIDIEFVKDAPPDVIYDEGGTGTNEIQLLAEVRNKGTFTTDVFLYLSGFDPNIIGLPSMLANTIKLEGKSIYNSEGGLAVVDFASDGRVSGGAQRGSIALPSKGGKPVVDSYSPKFTITACYAYETEASPVVCVDPDPYSITHEKSCRVGEVTGLGMGGQGAPVSISGVSTEIVPGKAIFEIRVSNSGQGRVITKEAVTQGGSSSAPSAGAKCPFNLGYSDLNLVDYVVTFQGDDISSTANRAASTIDEGCQPGRIRLVNGKGTLYCRFNVDRDQADAYKTPLQINLQYGYMSAADRDIEIKSTR
ncbi:MAG: hypothetical protein ABH879_10225 [archaeon]